MENAEQRGFDKLRKMVEEKSRVIVEANLGQHATFAFIIDKDAKFNIVDIVMGSEKSKFLLAGGFKILLQKLDAIAYVFISEAWATNFTVPVGKSIRDLPPDDRSEILWLSVVVKGKSVFTEEAKIETSPQGRKLGEWKEVAKAEGNFIVPDW